MRPNWRRPDERGGRPHRHHGPGRRGPGGIETPAQYWAALSEARDLTGLFPRDRGWPIERLLSLSEVEGWSEVRDAGGFLDAAAEFDPLFFGITPREAVAMDPQQRVALRVAWRALENAGINPGAIDGAEEVGCYMGASPTEYGPHAAEVNDYSGYRATGTALGAVAGRISIVWAWAGRRSWWIPRAPRRWPHCIWRPRVSPRANVNGRW